MSGAEHLHLSPQGFLFDHHSGISYTTNGVGAFILERWIAGRDRDRILGELRVAYEVTADRVSTDLDEFLALLRQYGLAGSVEESAQ